jgi:hypothetical protein
VWRRYIGANPDHRFAPTSAPQQPPAGGAKPAFRHAAQSMMPNWSCEGVPLANGRKRRRNASLARPKRAKSATVSAPPALPQASQAAPRRAGRRPCPSAGSPASHRNAKGKPSSPSPPQQPRPLPSSTNPPRESEDCYRFSSQPNCHEQFQSIALPASAEALHRRGSFSYEGLERRWSRGLRRRLDVRSRTRGQFVGPLGTASSPFPCRTCL